MSLTRLLSYTRIAIIDFDDELPKVVAKLRAYLDLVETCGIFAREAIDSHRRTNVTQASVRATGSTLSRLVVAMR